MDIRRLVVVKDIVYFEGGLPAVEPVTRVAACAVIDNPLAGLATDRLDVLIPWGAELGELFGVERSRDIGFAAAREFAFGAWPAPGAFNQQHVFSPARRR